MIFSMALVCLFVFAKVLTVQTIVVRDVYEKSTSVQDVNVFKNKPFFLLNRKSLFDELVRTNPTISYDTFEYAFSFPGTLTLFVSNIQPVAYVKVRNQFLTVAADGRILTREYSAPSGLGEVRTSVDLMSLEELRVGTVFTDSDVLFAIKLGALFKKYAITSYRISIVDKTRIECLLPASETSILVARSSDDSRTFDRLESYVKQMYMGGKSITFLDLRFEKIIVKE